MDFSVNSCIFVLFTQIFRSFYILHSTLNTLHSTLSTLCTRYTLHSTLYTLHSTLLVFKLNQSKTRFPTVNKKFNFSTSKFFTLIPYFLFQHYQSIMPMTTQTTLRGQGFATREDLTQNQLITYFGMTRRPAPPYLRNNQSRRVGCFVFAFLCTLQAARG